MKVRSRTRGCTLARFAGLLLLAASSTISGERRPISVSMRTRPTFNRKQAQLCSEVEQVVSLVLGSSSHPLLQQLCVVSVEISKDGACLIVSVAPPPSPSLPGETGEAVDMEAIFAALEGARAWVRQQIAVEINRKRTPEVRFQLVLRPEEFEP